MVGSSCFEVLGLDFWFELLGFFGEMFGVCSFVH